MGGIGLSGCGVCGTTGTSCLTGRRIIKGLLKEYKKAASSLPGLPGRTGSLGPRFLQRNRKRRITSLTVTMDSVSYQSLYIIAGISAAVYVSLRQMIASILPHIAAADRMDCPVSIYCLAAADGISSRPMVHQIHLCDPRLPLDHSNSGEVCTQASPKTW